MLTPVLAFRPARVVERLGGRSAACPLSSRDLLRAAAGLRLTLPVVRAPTPGVARAALVAAKQARSVLGLAMPPGLEPERWFAGVTAAADELAAGLPIFLAGEVRVAGSSEAVLGSAAKAAWRLADAGLTHLSVDLEAVQPSARAAALARVAAPALERGMGLDCLVTPPEGAEAGRLFAEAAARSAGPDLAGVSCHGPTSQAEAHGQLRELLVLASTLPGIPLLRRGPSTPELLRALRGGPIAACDDGGAAAAAGTPGRPAGGAAGALEPGGAEAGLGELERARLETRAYLEVVDFLERLGAGGSAGRVAQALAQRLAAG